MKIFFLVVLLLSACANHVPDSLHGMEYVNSIMSEKSINIIPLLDGGKKVYSCGVTKQFIERISSHYGNPLVLFLIADDKMKQNKIESYSYNWKNRIIITSYYRMNTLEESVFDINIQNIDGDMFKEFTIEIKQKIEAARQDKDAEVLSRDYIELERNYDVKFNDGNAVSYSCERLTD